MKRNVIMVVDDSPELRKILSLYMRSGGFEVLEAADGFEALQLYAGNQVDLAILDVMMPGMDGFELVQHLRKQSDIPILFLSARDHVSDKIAGLALGADDYLAKPFDPMEVLARVNALLRRQQTPAKSFEAGPLHWDTTLGRVFLEGSDLNLTSKEYDILTLLIANPRKVFTKDELYSRVWRDPFVGDDNVIMVHISNIRDKLGAHRNLIRTVKGLGYSLEAERKSEQV